MDAGIDMEHDLGLELVLSKRLAFDVFGGLAWQRTIQT